MTVRTPSGSSTITPGPSPAPVLPWSSSSSVVSPSCCSPCLECPGTHGSPAWMLSLSTSPPVALATLRLLPQEARSQPGTFQRGGGSNFSSTLLPSAPCHSRRLLPLSSGLPQAPQGKNKKMSVSIWPQLGKAGPAGGQVFARAPLPLELRSVPTVPASDKLPPVVLYEHCRDNLCLPVLGVPCK